ncbi:hypothetical protein [Alkaliphilus crotonatoxidans]
MKEKIYDRINHIDHLKDRALFRELLNGVFIPLYEHSQEMYQALEKRVFDEIEYTRQNYSVYTTIVKKQDYDPIHYYLHPMLPEDVEERTYDLNHILEAMVEKREVRLFKVFLECDYLLFKELLEKQVDFEGQIETNQGSRKATFRLKENTQYWDRIEKLYQIFIRNNIPWTTINAPYVARIADVVLVSHEKEISKDEEIQGIKVDFGQYSQYVRYDMVPLWNIQRLTLKSTGFPFPCEDELNYEHSISLNGEGAEHGFLVEYENQDIKYIRHTKDSLLITAQRDEAQEWEVYKVVKQRASKIEKYEYELISNSKDISFVEKLSSYKGANVKTKAELIRIINSYEASKYLQFEDIKIIDRGVDDRQETYNMNSFIIDEIRDSTYGKRLILYFSPLKPGYFILRDLLSFIISEIQQIYPEYHCEGRLI